ncbi:FAD-dependent oxidoreductase [Streptomyces griseoviridis]|uniref:FAD-dependent oxidoreductase n=1 Tax=Streptomyces griseoviridis TaxID=45398 RepID=UPI003409FAA4
MQFPTAGGPFFRRVRMWHAVAASLVVVAVVAFLVLRPSDDARAVPNSPCRAVDSAREAAPATPDLDGDGFADLVHEMSETEDFDLFVVPGSAHGPDPDRTTVFAHDDLGVPDDVQTGDDLFQPTVADLDEDGHTDLVVSGAAQILWGGPGGPRVGGAHGRVPLPGSGYHTAPVAGDFDGDGHTDLAVFRASNETQELVVLKGPFKRSGAPASIVEIPSPVHEGATPILVAGAANDDRATDLALYDSPWDPPLLLTGGARTASGLSKEPERLPEGENVVFGDFDGDGRQDIAIGRSFVDSDDEVDTPHRRGQVSVRYGKEPGKWVTLDGGDFEEGFGTSLAVGDFNGDGCDAAELLPGLRVPRFHPVTVVHHTTDEAPDTGASLLLDADRGGPVAHTAVVSRVDPSRAPAGRALVTSTVLGTPPRDVDTAVRAHLARLYGTSTSRWETLAVHHTAEAVPSMRPPHDPRRPVRLLAGLYVCGDHRDTSSVQGALHSGHRASAAIIRDLGASGSLNRADPPRATPQPEPLAPAQGPTESAEPAEAA